MSTAPAQAVDTYYVTTAELDQEHRPAEADPMLSAPIVAALEHTWDAIRARHADLPAVVMVLASGSDGGPGRVVKARSLCRYALGDQHQ